MDRCSTSQAKKWILTGIPILFLTGSLLHFAYELSGKNILIALIAPVNESVWEHSKMVLWPVILWWGAYCCKCNLFGAIRGRWLTGTGIALLTALSVMPMLYYFYTKAFGVELLWADILILFLSVLTGQLAGLHFYDHSSGDCGKAAVLFIMMTVLLFVFFTFRPPHLPWFQDGSTGVFGIGLQ